MLTRFRRDPMVGNVMALVALFIALGGVAWAAATINSGDVINNSLKSIDLKDDKGVKGVDVVPESLDGTDIEEGSLSQVPSAVDAETLDGATASDFVVPGSEGWQAGSGFSSTACSWQNYGGAQSPGGYFRDPAGVVHLRGLVRAQDEGFGPCNFAAAPAQREPLYLPAGYLPEHDLALATISNNAPARVNVLRDSNSPFTNVVGAVAIEPGFPSDANAKQWVSLDGLSFRCGPSGVDGCP